MKPANYAVIRYVADPARNEARNLGIIVWDDTGYRLRIDDEAVGRMIRENPHLERDALLYLDSHLRSIVSPNDANEDTADLAERLVTLQQGFPMVVTEPRFTTVGDDALDALGATLDRLVARVVQPRRRFGGTAATTAQVLAKRLQPLIKHRLVSRNHPFRSSRTGVPRTVDFFANSGANVAVDALRLSLKKADDIRLRADAEAFKVEDIRSQNDIRFVVLCDFSEDEAIQDANTNARQVIESVGAVVVSDVEEAARTVERAVGQF